MVLTVREPTIAGAENTAALAAKGLLEFQHYSALPYSFWSVARAVVEFHVGNDLTGDFDCGGFPTAAPQPGKRSNFLVTDALAFVRDHLALHCKTWISPNAATQSAFAASMETAATSIHREKSPSTTKSE